MITLMCIRQLQAYRDVGKALPYRHEFLAVHPEQSIKLAATEFILGKSQGYRALSYTCEAMKSQRSKRLFGVDLIEIVVNILDHIYSIEKAGGSDGR